MEQLDYFDEEDTAGTVFRDVLLLALLGFVAIVVMLLPHITTTKEEAEDHRAPGNVIVEMHWPTGLKVDVDLWVKAPGELPVGFWNQSGMTFNLLRDDLGAEGDATEENYEITYSRGIPPGEYVVNAHMYGALPTQTTIPVNIVVSVKKKFDEAHQILQTNIDLVRHNEEKTAFRFRLTEEGDLVENSVSTLRYPLITELK